MKQLIKDYKIYLDEIEKLSVKLNKEQKEKLKNILSVQLTMLICFKKASNLGTISWRITDKIFNMFKE